MNNEIDNVIPPLDDSAMLSLSPLPDDAPEWAKVLNENIGQVMSTMNRTMVLVDGVTQEVSPLVNSLSKNPMFKMFAGGK